MFKRNGNHFWSSVQKSEPSERVTAQDPRAAIVPYGFYAGRFGKRGDSEDMANYVNSYQLW